MKEGENETINKNMNDETINNNNNTFDEEGASELSLIKMDMIKSPSKLSDITAAKKNDTTPKSGAGHPGQRFGDCSLGGGGLYPHWHR